jgi:hypothetical protein
VLPDALLSIFLCTRPIRRHIKEPTVEEYGAQTCRRADRKSEEERAVGQAFRVIFGNVIDFVITGGGQGRKSRNASGFHPFGAKAAGDAIKINNLDAKPAFSGKMSS